MTNKQKANIIVASCVAGLVALALFGKQLAMLALFFIAVIGFAAGNFAPPIQSRISDEGKASKFLSAKIVSVERDKYNYMHPLVVVTNTSDQTYQLTHWDCIFYQNGAPVNSDTFSVRRIRPGETAFRGLTPGHQFDRSDCRLTLVSGD